MNILDSSSLLLLQLVILSQHNHVSGHGYIQVPPGRSSAWRQGFGTPRNNDDNGLNCGGFNRLHSVNGGRCGVCGDDYSLAVKPNEPGPGNKYARGVLVGHYTQGQIVQVKSVITAFHKGYIGFKLCSNDVKQSGYDADIRVSQECFDVNVLASPSGNTRFPAKMGKNDFTIQLPADVTCDACVLQWKYRAGNNWGKEVIDGDTYEGIGYGAQEEFVNCADIRISADNKMTTDEATSTTIDKSTPSAATTIPATSLLSTTSTASTRKSSLHTTASTPTAIAVECYGILNKYDGWCAGVCNLDMSACHPETCWCVGSPLPMIKRCQGRLGGLTSWCNTNCNHTPVFCPEDLCLCEEKKFDPRLE